MILNTYIRFLINLYKPVAYLFVTVTTVAAETPAIDEIFVPSGKYYVGPVFGHQNYHSHTNAAVSSFYIMKTEVTYNLYRTVFDWGLHHGYILENPCEDCFSDINDGEKPIYAISWNGAAVWANALSEMAGIPPYYRDENGETIRTIEHRADLVNAPRRENATGYRLPSLEEWHIAARGAQKALDSGTYGYRHSGSDHIDEVAWHAGRSQGTGPTSVGALKPNQIGLYDMSGNVAEWTATPATDLGADGQPSKRRYLYYCGESWANSDALNLSFCDFHSSGFQEGDIGFRLVRSREGK